MLNVVEPICFTFLLDFGILARRTTQQIHDTMFHDKCHFSNPFSVVNL